MENEDTVQVNLGGNIPSLEIEPLTIYQFDDEEERIFMEMADENEALHFSSSQEEETNTDRRLGQPIHSSGSVENTWETTQE